MGPYPITPRRKQYILVVTDLFSRWVEAFALPNSEAPLVIKTIENEIFSRWGYPRAVLSDNGPQFSSRAWIEACSRWQVEPWTTAIYSPRANPTERRNQEIKKGLKLHLQGRKHTAWDLCLPQILYNLRTRSNAATGRSPGRALLGQELKKPGEWKLKEARSTSPTRNMRVLEMRDNQERYIQGRYDITNDKKSYKTGDYVYARTHPLSNAIKKFHAGFAQKFDGPYQIVDVLSSNMYVINRNGDIVKCHINDFKPARQAPNRCTSAASDPHDASAVEDGNDGQSTEDQTPHDALHVEALAPHLRPELSDEVLEPSGEGEEEAINEPSDEEQDNLEEALMATEEPEEESAEASRYNLRPRKLINYKA